jgi:SAM-dependent methyltransferase
MTKPADSLTDDTEPTSEVANPVPEVKSSGPVADSSASIASNGEASRESVDHTPDLPAPVGPLWGAAQPLAPMQDDATVPLPVEDIEFAGPDALLDEQPSPLREVDFGDSRQSIERISSSERPRTAPPLPPGLPAAGSSVGAPEARSAQAEHPPPGPTPPAPAGGSSDASRTRRPSPPPIPTPAVPAGGSAQVNSTPPGPASDGSPAADTPAQTLLSKGVGWTEALSQRPRRKRLKPWFEEVFDEDYLRTLPFMTPEGTLREVAFIRQSLRPPPDGQILDVACGYGRHAIELGQSGLRVTGIDLSLPLLIRAADESQRRALSVNFIHADMREMIFDNQFDAAYCVLTSFGYFDEETNLKVATSICRALKPGGRFLLDTVNRDYIVSELPTRIWWEGDGCVVLEEVDFNFHTSRLAVRRSVVFQDGRQVEHDISIRAYSLHELGRLLRQAGFRVLEVSGALATRGHFFGSTSRNVIVLCERPTD